METNGIAKFK